VYRALSFILSTAPPPPVVGAARAALGVLEAEPERVGRLAMNARALRDALAAEGLATGESTTQIVPIEIGDAEPTMELCERLLERGVFAQGIRPPTVPEGSSRLRFTVMATHAPAELRRAAHEVGEAARAIGLLKAPTIAA
jgi:7-keto-8-aminopelargonate synthetase-like enzyme